jgi:uncharacterized protein
MPRRIDAIDFVRGIAILGIFVMNVRDFGLPLAWFDRPALAGGTGPLNVAAWATGTLLFQDKMIALLSLLFGAGLVLQARASVAEGLSATARWLRRCAWLLLIGVAHALLLWFGDILNTYAICGLLLWPLARLRARWLVAIGALLYAVPLCFMFSGTLVLPSGPPVASRPPDVSKAMAIWAHGGYLDALRENWNLFVPWHLEGGWRISFWRSGGLMVIGMALAKSGVLEAAPEDPRRRRLLAWGYGVGLPCTIAVAASLLCSDLARTAGVDFGELRPWLARFAFVRRGVMHLAAAVVALGHLALLLQLAQRRPAAAPVRALAAVGRAALSCYLLQTVIACLFFWGYGGGLFGALSFAQLWLLIAAVWALELELCRRWFARFAIGPCEWAWRSLAEWRRRPWRATINPPAAR